MKIKYGILALTVYCAAYPRSDPRLVKRKWEQGKFPHDDITDPRAPEEEPNTPPANNALPQGQGTPVGGANNAAVPLPNQNGTPPRREDLDGARRNLGQDFANGPHMNRDNNLRGGDSIGSSVESFGDDIPFMFDIDDLPGSTNNSNIDLGDSPSSSHLPRTPQRNPNTPPVNSIVFQTPPQQTGDPSTLPPLGGSHANLRFGGVGTTLPAARRFGKRAGTRTARGQPTPTLNSRSPAAKGKSPRSR